MTDFKIKKYRIYSSKIKSNPGIRMAVLSDLHGCTFGRKNQRLTQAIRRQRPDMILILGDLNVHRDISTLETARELLLSLSAQYPVFYALGNHEEHLSHTENSRDFYTDYERILKKAGITFLHNEHAHVQLKGNDIEIHGLELPLSYYHKPNSPKLPLDAMNHLLPPPKTEAFHILLAHNPKYGDTYFEWNADLILSGHYHGGMVRFGRNNGLISPYFQLFPAYCCGCFQRGRQSMIVSAGLGEHTIPVRIHNPRELLLVELKSLAK